MRIDGARAITGAAPLIPVVPSVPVAGRSRFPALPDVPTAAEAGLNGYEIDFWYALGPAGMRAPLAARMQRDAAAIPTTPEMKESLLAQGCIEASSGRK